MAQRSTRCVVSNDSSRSVDRLDRDPIGRRIGVTQDLSGGPDRCQLESIDQAGCGALISSTIDELHRVSKPRAPSAYLMAIVYVGLGDNNRAFDWLQRAV